MHIENLYKHIDLLAKFRELYAMEKIHGTSAHVMYKKDTEHTYGMDKEITGTTITDKLVFFSGGAKYDNFMALFNHDELLAKFRALGHDKVTVYGEAYGGNMQGMSHTYGNKLKFIAFDVQITTPVGEYWLAIPAAEKVATELGFEFVHYKLIPATIEAVNAEKDADSVQAVRNGMGPGHMREGIVLRPTEESTRNNGARIIVKHKRDEFRETAKPRPLDAAKLEALTNAEEIAVEWVTPERLLHVMDKLGPALGCKWDMPDTPRVIKAMVEDVIREGAGEIVWSDAVGKAVATQARKLFHAKVKGS